MHDILNSAARVKELRARCEVNNLSLKLEGDPDHTVPCATYDANTGKALIIAPQPAMSWTKDDWVRWEYAIEHEVGHLMPEVVDVHALIKRENIDMRSFVGMCLNCAEDHRQERHDWGLYAGRARRLEEGRALFMDMDWSYLGKNPDPHRQAAEVMLVWDCMIREPWMRSLSGTADNLLRHMTEQQSEWIEKLMAGDYGIAFESNPMMTADEEYELVKRIIDEVFEFNLDEEIENATQQGQGDGDGSDDAGTGGNNPGQNGESGDDDGNTSGSKSEGEGEAQGQDGEAGEGDSDEDSGSAGDGAGDDEQKGQAQGSESSSEDGQSGESQQFTQVDYSDLLAHQHDEEFNGQYGEGMHINYGDRAYDEFEPADPKDYKLRDYTKDAKPKNGAGTAERITESDHGKGLAKKVRRLLQVKAQSRYQHGLKRGKISSRSIYRTCVGGAASERVFKKKQVNDVLDTCVMMAVDASGSMSGNKSVNAGISAVLLNEAISKIGVPVEIVTFDESDVPRHAVLKTFSKSVSDSDLAARYADATYWQGGCNSDGESLIFCYERLTKRKEKRKILLVLSDGSPASMNGDADTHLAKVVEAIEKAQQVDLYAIGIKDRNVERFYKQHASIDHADELEGAILNVIKDSILN